MNNCLFVIGNESGPICIGAAIKKVLSIYYPNTNRSSKTIYNKVKFLIPIYFFEKDNFYILHTKIIIFLLIFSTPMNASGGISTLPNCFDLALPFFVFPKVFFSICSSTPMNFSQNIFFKTFYSLSCNNFSTYCCLNWYHKIMPRY